jgi:hypothetical protein
MQIAQINEKDLIDTMMLLREHPLGKSDAETINIDIICALLSNDWGFWRTVTGNLKLTYEIMDQYTQLTEQDKLIVRARIDELLGYIEQTPKSSRWKLRSKVGEKVKWYKDVEELADR